jgi:hypothetical protein
MLRRDLARRDAELQAFLAQDLLDRTTHGHLASAVDTLEATRRHVAHGGGQAAERVGTIEDALRHVRAMESGIRDSRPIRQAWDRDGDARRPARSLAASQPYHPEGDPMRLIGDPANLPRWAAGSPLRVPVLHLGSVLDDVRLLHTPALEALTLRFTLWARMLLVGLTLLLYWAGWSASSLEDGPSVRSLPWASAVVISLITAITAPAIAERVMRHDGTGQRTRRLLLAIEVPVTVAVLLLTPCWPVATFAAGWTNWWQRPSFSASKLILWGLAVAGAMSAGMAIQGASATAIAIECVVALGVVALIGDSLGVLLPLSIAAFVRVLSGRVRCSWQARRTADRALAATVTHLRTAASLVETAHVPDDPVAARDADTLRAVANALGASADRRDRRAQRAPRGLAPLVTVALERGAARTDSARAHIIAHQAMAAGEPEPLTVLPVAFYEGALRACHLRERRDAQALAQLITEIVNEANRYGTGPLTTQCTKIGDRIVLRFANVIRSTPVAAGRGSGQERLEQIARRIPGGRLDRRAIVDGTFVNLPAAARRFGVQISFPTSRISS